MKQILSFILIQIQSLDFWTRLMVVSLSIIFLVIYVVFVKFKFRRLIVNCIAFLIVFLSVYSIGYKAYEDIKIKDNTPYISISKQIDIKILDLLSIKYDEN